MTTPIPFNCRECEFPIPDVEVDIPRPPPPCSNPDSLAFSDSGDAGGIYNLPINCPNCGTSFDEAAELESALETLADNEEDPREYSREMDFDDDYVDPRDFDEPDWESPLIRRKL